MRSCIRRLFSFSVLALFAATLLSSLSGAVQARSPIAGQYTIFGETVGADPGEDPHLTVDPMVDLEISRDLQGGSSSSTADGVDSAIKGGHRETGYKAGAGRSRVKTKLLITLQMLFGPIFR
jgi:hypothetical protein